MPRGRPRLTQRSKLNKKLERLYKEIETIKTTLNGQFEDDVQEAIIDTRTFIEKGV